jgi:hypothetical protein
MATEKAAVYAALKDLEFEHKTGKLSDEDYSEMREGYRAKALNILKVIDEREAVAELSPPRCDRCGHANPRGSNFCEACGADGLVAGSACAACGAPGRPGDRYCRTCGQQVA